MRRTLIHLVMMATGLPLMGGCSYARYEDPAGHKITVCRSMLDTNIASATIVKADGTRIELRGFQQKVNAEAVGAAVTAALKASSLVGGVP